MKNRTVRILNLKMSAENKKSGFLKLSQDGLGYESGQIFSEVLPKPKQVKLPFEVGKKGPIIVSGAEDGRTYYYNPQEGQGVFYVVTSPNKKEIGRYVENFSDWYFVLLRTGVGDGMDVARSQYADFLDQDPELKEAIDLKIERDKKNRELALQNLKEKEKKQEVSTQEAARNDGNTEVTEGGPSRRRTERPTPIARGDVYTGPTDQESIKAIIRREFTATGFPISLANAAIVNAKHESQLNNPRYMVGDGGNSVGLFQLNIRGAGNWIIERDASGRVIHDPRMDPVQNTRGIIAELRSRLNERKEGFPSIREALDLNASVPELAGLFCFHIERPTEQLRDANVRARDAMKMFPPAPSKNMYGVVYDPGKLASGAQSLFPMRKPIATPAPAPATANESIDRLIKVASIQLDLGNQEAFEDVIIAIAKSKNVPTNKKLWERAKAAAKARFDIYPSAYANAWASRWYKIKGGGWRNTKGKSNKAEDQMAAGSLSKLTDDTAWLKENMMEMEESEVPEWVEYLISQVARDMSHVIDYMKHRNESDGKMYVAQLAQLNNSADKLKDVMTVLSEEDVPEWVESLVSDMVSDIGHVKDYIEHGHHHKKASKIFDPLFYFQSKWADYTTDNFFFEKLAVYRDSGLGRWFKEKWVDISRKDKSGRYAPCGRSDAKPGSYPKCRPSKKVSKQTPETTGEMTSKEKKSAISQKRRKQQKRKSDTKGQKPIIDYHSKRD